MPLRRTGHQRESWARSADGLLLAARNFARSTATDTEIVMVLPVTLRGFQSPSRADGGTSRAAAAAILY